MQVVILAGGKGTRLRERLGDLPKPLIDLNGLPLLERQILLAKRFDFKKVIILVNYRSEYIVQFCASKNNWGLEIECIDDGEPRGTAGAVLQILDKLNSEFLVMYGDTMLEVDLSRFASFHAHSGPNVAASLFLHPNDHPHDSDLVELDEDNVVTGFYPYPHEKNRFYPNLVNAALYIVRRKALEPWVGMSGMLDFGKQLFPMMIQSGLKLRGYNSPEYIKDCGTPERIDKVVADFISGKIHRSGLEHPQRAVFIDRDGTINREVNHLKNPEDFELLPGTESAIKRLNKSEYRVCVVTNQPVIARGECTVPMLRQIHNKLETLLGREGAFVDRIYYCPHHPDKGFSGEIINLKIDCNCRKPKIGMIEKAVTELNIDLKQSWMIGDTTSDILSAKNAGLKSILVETGYAGLDSKYFATPDYVLPNLEMAVEFIIDIHPKLMGNLANFAKSIQVGSIVLVGGQSRSGKSTMASVLRDSLMEMGKVSHVISTDRWLLNEKDRKPGVLGRHDIDALYQFINAIKNNPRPFSLELPAYKKNTREYFHNVETLFVENSDIVILEGVISLSLASLIPSAFLVYVDINEEVRRQRILREYMLRGYEENEALQIYEQRLSDEFTTVDKFKSLTTNIVNGLNFLNR